MNVKEKNFKEKQIFDLQPLNGQGQRPPNFDMMRWDMRMYKTVIAISPTDEISTSSILQCCVKDGQDS